MKCRHLFVSSFAAFALTLGGSLLADSKDGAGMPKSVEDPVSDPAKQAKTEAMLEAEEKALSGDQGAGMPSSVAQPAPDPAAQAKTEEMLEAEKDALQGK